MAEGRDICIVDWQVASYSGQIVVYCDYREEDEYVKKKAERLVRNQQFGGSFPFGVREFWVISREPYDGEFED